MSGGHGEDSHEGGWSIEREQREVDGELERGRKELEDAERSYQAELEELSRTHPERAAQIRETLEGKIQWLGAELDRAEVEVHRVLNDARKAAEAGD